MSTVRANSILDSSGGNTAQINGMTPTAQSLQGFRNRIINGDQRIHQRGGTLSTNNSQGYFVDRMWGFSSLTAATFSQVSNTGLSGFPFAVRGQRNAGNTGTGGVYLGQIVESVNMLDLQGQSVTVSFWARAGSNYSATANALTVTLVTGTTADQGLNQLIAGWAGMVNQTSSVTLTTSWQYFSRTFSVASNAQELSVYFSGFNTGTAGANDFFDITGVQLEAGSVATPFERRDYGRELIMCQRYFQRSTFDVAGYGGASGSILGQLSFPVRMRAVPTYTQLANNVNFTQSNVTSSSSTVIADEGRISLYRLSSTTSNTQFSESFSVSAEL